MKKYASILIGLLLCAAGFGGWVLQIVKGLSVTNLSNAFSWGLYMGSFEFFIGLSSGGMILFSIAYLWDVESLLPFTKMAAVSSLASVGAAGVAILTDLGKPFRVLQMLLTPNIGSPLFWDVVILGLYAIICLAACWFQLRGDLPRNRGNRGVKMDGDIHSKRLSRIALPYIVVLNAGTTLMFAVQNTREWWHSAILPADSVAVATALGVSFMILLCTIAIGKEDYEKYARGQKILKMTAGIALLVHFVFTILEIVTIYWSGNAEGRHLLSIVFGDYGTVYALELILPFIAMVFYLAVRGKHLKSLSVMNIFVILGIFLHRMMLLLPAFNAIPLTFSVAGLGGSLWTYPISSGVIREGEDLFVRFWNYFPSAVEWMITLLPIGIIVLLVGAVIALCPVTKGTRVEIPSGK